MMKYLFVTLFLCLSCQPTTPKDFALEGKAWMGSVTEELKKVHSKEDLEKKLPFLTKKFNELAHLILLIEKKQNAKWITEEKESAESLLLQEQLERISLLPGAKEIFETAQLEALQTLSRIRRKS